MRQEHDADWRTPSSGVRRDILRAGGGKEGVRERSMCTPQLRRDSFGDARELVKGAGDHMRTCQLCFAGSTEAWDEPLIELPNFMVLPSLGALVEGWVLIVPKKHFLSLATLPDSLTFEMRGLQRMLCERLQRIYGPVAAFEHGPAAEQRTVGCGVDHAHMHIVPVDFDLSVAVAPYLPPGSTWSEATVTDCRIAVQEGDDYLYLEQPLGRPRIVRHGNLGSQLFRRAIASHLGVPDDFNWRNNPQIENVDKTIRTFKTAVQTDSEFVV